MPKSGTFLFASAAALLAGGVGAAPPHAPIGNPITTAPLPRGGGIVNAATCHVDPAVRLFVLERGAGANAGKFRAIVEVTNAGRNAWRSAPGQGVLTITLTNGNTGAKSAHSFSLPVSAAPAMRMGMWPTPWVASAFDTHEFSGTARAEITYDPDIGTDANPCNDDANAGNNVKEVSAAQVQAFLASGRPQMGF